MSEWGRLQDALHDEFDRQGVERGTGRRMYRTRNGVPMEMPAKVERLVRAALSRPSDERDGEGE